MKEEERMVVGRSDSDAASAEAEAARAPEAAPAPDSPIPAEAEGEACMICGQQQAEGLHICGEFICVDCEREMINTDVRDAKYPFFIHRMKQVWQRKNA